MSKHTPVAELAPPTVIRNVGTVESFAPLPDQDGRYPGGIAVIDRHGQGAYEQHAVGLVYFVDDAADETERRWQMTNGAYELTRWQATEEQARQLKVWS